MKRHVCTMAITLTLMALPAVTFGQADPHTNITPIEVTVEKNIDAFERFVRFGDFTREELSEAVTDLQAVLDFYIKTLE